MTVRCPQCGSLNIKQTNHITATSAGIGALGGITATLTKALSQGVPVGGVTFVANVLVSSLFSGLAGSLLGAKIGSEIEQSMPSNYHCNTCNNSFQPIKQLN